MDGRQKKFILELQKKPRVRRESGLFCVDGPKMAAELPFADAADIYVTKEFLQSEHARVCDALLREKGYTLVTESEMRQISDTVTPQGILVVARQKRLKGLRGLLEAGGPENTADCDFSSGVHDPAVSNAGCHREAALRQSPDGNAKKQKCSDGGQRQRAPFLMILETLQDPGNLGTILRASEAAGITGVLMNRETVDVYAPKTVRSTMGALFRIPFLVVEDLESAVQSLKSGTLTDGVPVQILAAHLKGAVDYTLADYRRPTAIMIGNESRGLSDEITALSDQAVRIPMCGSVESLNAAMAATILAFEGARQRRL